MEGCVGNVVRECREVDAVIVPEKLELIASCEGINVLEGEGKLALLGRMVEVGTTTRFVSDEGGILDVGAAVE